MNLKKILLSVSLLAVSIFSASAQTYMFGDLDNDDLRASMITYIKGIQSDFVGTRYYTDLDRLVSEVNASSASRPYAWINQTMSFVLNQTRMYPAQGDNAITTPDLRTSIRRSLLVLWDYPMHSDMNLDSFISAYTSFYNDAVKRLLAWLKSSAPASGKMEVFKFLNMGVFVRTANHCVAFDVYWPGTAAQAAEAAKYVDATFVTHAHGDHYSKDFLTSMSARSSASMFLQSDVPDASGYTDSGVAAVYKWNEDHMTATDANGVSVRAAYGAQGTEPCMIYCAEMDGWCVWAAGDNTSTTGTSNMTGFTAPDVITTSLASTASDICFKAKSAKGGSSTDKFYLVSHDNEVHHAASGRPGFKFFFESKDHYLKNTSACMSIGSFLALLPGEHITLSK